jgi:hypothetical protein
MYNSRMKKKQRKEDESQAAARIVQTVAVRHSEALPADLEAAWEQWSKGIQNVDQRGRTLLRAAFEAGAEAAKAKPSRR